MVSAESNGVKCQRAGWRAADVPKQIMPLQTAQTERPYRVWRVLVNDTSVPPEMVHEEPDEAFSLSLSQTHNRQHLLLYGESQSTKYLLSIPAASPRGESSLRCKSTALRVLFSEGALTTTGMLHRGYTQRL